MRAAENYSIDGLKLLCEDTMVTIYTTKKSIKYLIELDRNNSTKVEKIIEFIAIDIENFIIKPEFESLKISHPHLMFDVMKAVVQKKVSK